VQRIEVQTLQLPVGAFGLDTAFNKQQAAVLEAVRNVLPNCPGCSQPLEIRDQNEYLDLIGSNGTRICDTFVDRNEAYKDAPKPLQTRTIHKREATLVRQYRTAVGMVEVWCYHMFGCDNLNLLVRPFTATEESTTSVSAPSAVAEPIPAPVTSLIKEESPATPATLEQLQSLADRFNPKKRK
jgi:hypothetical protein